MAGVGHGQARIFDRLDFRMRGDEGRVRPEGFEAHGQPAGLPLHGMQGIGGQIHYHLVSTANDCPVMLEPELEAEAARFTPAQRRAGGPPPAGRKAVSARVLSRNGRPAAAIPPRDTAR